MGTIRVRRRGDEDYGDWLAESADDPRCWDCGRTASEAVGQLIRGHPAAFGIEIEIAESPGREARRKVEGPIGGIDAATGKGD